MDKLTIGIIQPATNYTESEEIREILTSPTMHEICSTVTSDNLQSCIESNECDAIVIKTHSQEPPALPAKGCTIFLSDNIKIAIGNEEDIIGQLQSFADVLQRDFNCLAPRLALLGEADPAIIQQADDKKLCLYGPYTAEAMLEEARYQHFDGILALQKNEASTCFKGSSAQYRICYYAGQEIPVSEPYSSQAVDLSNAIYTVIDICRNRDIFDEANENPLPKLYHERREEKTHPAAMERQKNEAV